jgi:dolichyl-phosphate-mannose--protein O-mannosyl transferase
MKNFQFIPYTLIAVGLINAVYRNSDSTALNTSYLLILFGSAIFLASRNESTQKYLENKTSRIAILITSGLLILLTLIR